MNKKLAILGVLVIVVGSFLSGSLFTVHQAAQGIVMQFGDPKRVVRDPGLNFKLPFVQNVVYYDKRILNIDPPSEEMQLADKKRVVVDAFARWRIIDPLRFFQSIRTVSAFRDTFGRNLNAGIRNELGLHLLVDLLSPKRETIMDRIQSRLNLAAKNFGIEVVDIRIVRTELPKEISQNVYQRMQSERARIANELRAQGEEKKQEIVANADRQRTVIVAEARKNSEILRGEGDAQRNTILAEAYNKDPEFFKFYRSLEAYRKSLKDDTTMVLSPDSDFFRFFGDITGKAGQ